MIVKITTIGDVNARTGAGMEFNSVHTVKRGTTLESSKQQRDAVGNIWYEVQQGWICGKYITLDRDLQKPDLNKRLKKIQKNILNRFADDEETDDEAEDGEEDDDEDEDNPEQYELTPDEVEARRRQNSGYDENGNYVGGETGQGGTLIPGVNDNDSAYDPNNTKDFHLARKIFGVPYQFLKTTDMRGSEVKSNTDAELGLAYTEMMNEAPILCVLPGRPMFLPDLTDEQKNGFISFIADKVNEMSQNIAGAAGELLAEDMDTRFFSFATDYSDFIHYFNTLCRSCAVMMGLGSDMMPPGSGQYQQFRYYNWAGYTLSNILAGRLAHGSDGWENAQAAQQADLASQSAGNIVGDAIDAFKSGDKDKLLDIAHKFDASSMYTDFYINPAISYSESFGNSISASAIAGMFESASDMAKDIGFFLNTGAVSQDLVNKSNQSAAQALDQVMKKNLEGNNGIFARLIKGTTTVLSGANLIFPEIWKNSQYSKSYSIEIPLATPYGTRRNIFLDILVPMLFWVTMAAPRQYSVNSYGSPFLIRCHVPGIFSIDCGIVESLTITKGGDGSAWSVEGFPLQMNLSISIRELYNEIPISALHPKNFATDAYNFLWNTGLIDYLAVQSCMNMKTSELMKKLDIATSLASMVPMDAARGVRLKAHEAWVNSQTLAMGAKKVLKKIGQISPI